MEEDGAFKCDDYGKCKCRPNFAGDTCNKCANEKHVFPDCCLDESDKPSIGKFFQLGKDFTFQLLSSPQKT